MTSKQILFVSEYGALNGGEFSFMTALPFLQDAGFHFTALLPAESDFAKRLQQKGVTVEPFSFHEPDDVEASSTGPRIRKSQSHIRDEIGDAIDRLQPDLVHANSLAASRILGPVTGSRNVIGLGYARDIIKLSKTAILDLNGLDRLVAVSQATADFHVERGLDRTIVQVIHNGVDLKKFYPVNSNRDSKARICLCIGQIGMRKGLDSALEMMARVCRSQPDVTLWIVGERHSQKQEAIEFEQRLREISQVEFAEGSVKWLGRRDDVAHLMRQADILIHAARQEPLGRVLLEAAASGLPIVTTNVGGTPEIMLGLKQFMFPPDHFGDAFESVIQLLQDDILHREVSASLRRIAETRFSSDLAGKALARCYLDLL
jgi:glycosyltransferase involved in cell wall biosynthesis